MTKRIIVRHDPDYIAMRNECIEAAEEYSNLHNGILYGVYNEYKTEDEWRSAWNKDFHSKMDEMAKSGLRRRKLMDEQD